MHMMGAVDEVIVDRIGGDTGARVAELQVLQEGALEEGGVAPHRRLRAELCTCVGEGHTCKGA